MWPIGNPCLSAVSARLIVADDGRTIRLFSTHVNHKTTEYSYILWFCTLAGPPSCRRKIEMALGAQSRDDTPLAADATTQPLQRD